MSDRLSGEQRAAGFPVLTVLALMAGIFAVGSEELVVSPLLASMAGSFDTSVAVMALSVSTYGIATAVGALLFAPLGDRFSRRLALTIGMGAFVLGTLMCAFATGTGVFFTGRALAGLATGAFVPTAYAFVGDQIPYQHRGRAMGILVSSWSISLVVGVPLGSFVGEAAGWRWTFGLLSVLGVFVTCVMLFTKSAARPDAEDTSRSTEDSATPSPDGWLRSAARAFLAPKVALYVLATFLNMLGFYGMYTYLGTALQDRFGDGSSMTGVMILLYGLGFATSFVTGRWADRLGKERVLVGLLAGLVPALAVIPQVSRWTGLLVLCLFLWGAMQSLVVTLLSTLLSETSQTHRGTILAFYSLATNLAVALGAALLGPLFTAYGFSAVGWVCAGVTLIAFALSGWARLRGGGRTAVPDGATVPLSGAEAVAREN
ncbi:Inner membrane transport protein YdhP [Streptomyces xanthophaeus]|uniref:MFS transporter n=1 Tax=Streptomyces xanthophaeus TaxID=67385 RepID=UPI00233EA71E|nr:MFS transporter [Streptomyces xanthophaeus]WCD89742.1 Inner membrane transport protein YdhP [Streptomyces xanthophaeus]